MSERTGEGAARDGARQLGTACAWLTACGLLIVFYTTLEPFDFRPRALSLDAYLAQYRISSSDPYDMPLNVLLFAPLGAGLAGWARASGAGAARALGLALGAGIALTLLVESLQALVPQRQPTLSDLAANSLGALLGALGLIGAEGWLRAGAARCALARAARLALALGGAVALALAALWLHGAVEPRNWDPGHPLLLGNERTGERPWRGAVYDLALFDRALSEVEARGLLAGTLPEPGPLAHYRPTRAERIPDLHARLPALVWRGDAVGEAPADAAAGGALLGSGRWLESETSIAPWTRRVRAAGAFALAVTAQAGATRQGGPARLVSISENSWSRNLTLGQLGDGLVVRMRLPLGSRNGTQPSLTVPRVFSDTAVHRVVLSYDGTTLRVWIDRPEREHAIRLAPGIALARFLPPREVWSLTLASRVGRGYDAAALALGALLVVGLVLLARGAPQR
jgi:VanZ family protein